MRAVYQSLIHPGSVSVSIVEWPYNSNTDVWEELTQGPAGQVLSTWVSDLKNLTWLPWRFENARYIDSRPTKYDRLLQEGPDALSGLDAELAKALFNEFDARRRIYEDCGWPDNFDLSMF